MKIGAHSFLAGLLAAGAWMPGAPALADDDLIFADDFESGDVQAWSYSVGLVERFVVFEGFFNPG